MIRKMRAFIITLCAVVAITAPHAYAQDEGGYLPNPAAQAEQTLPPGQMALEPQEELDRKQFANQYYDRCIAEDDPSMEGPAQDETCICHSVHMLQHLETEELRTIGTGAGGVPVRKDVLFTQVYAPCLEFAVADMEKRRCYQSNMVRQLVTTQQMYEGTCACISRGASAFVREYNQVHMAALMKRNPAMLDPLGSVMRSYEFRDEVGRLYKKCLNTYVQ